MFGIKLSMKDSRGKESITLTMVVIGWAILCAKFLLSGVALPKLGVQQLITPAEFGAAFALVLAPWIGREWTEKK